MSQSFSSVQKVSDKAFKSASALEMKASIGTISQKAVMKSPHVNKDIISISSEHESKVYKMPA